MGHEETRRPAFRVMVNRQVWGQSGGQGGGRSELLHRAPIHGPCFCRWCIQERDSQGGERPAALYRAPIHEPCSCRRCMQDDEHDSSGTGQIVTGPDSDNWRARPQQARRAETYLHAPPSQPTQTTNYSPPSAYNASSPSSIPQHYGPPVPPPPPQYAPSSMPHGQFVPPRFPGPHAPPNVYQPQPHYLNNAPHAYNYQGHPAQPYPGPPPHPHPAHTGQASGQGYHQTYGPHTQQTVHGGQPAPVYTHTHGQQYPQQHHVFAQPHPPPLCATCQSHSRRPAQALPPVNAHTKAAWQAIKSVTQPLAAPSPKLNPSSREFRPRSVSWPPASTGPNVQGSQNVSHHGQPQVSETSQCPSQARPPTAANTQMDWRAPKSVTQPLATLSPNLNPYPYSQEFRPRSGSWPPANTRPNVQGSHGWPQAPEQRQKYCGGNASRIASPGLVIAPTSRVKETQVQVSKPVVHTALQRPAMSNVQVSPPVLRAPPTTPNNSFESRSEWSYPAPDFPLRKNVSTSSITTTAAKRYTVIVGKPPAQRQTAIVEKPPAKRYTVYVGEPPAQRYTVTAKGQSETSSQSSSTAETSSSASLSPSSSVPPRSVTPALGPPPGLVHSSALSQRGNSTVTTPTSVVTAPPATVHTRSDGTQHSPYYGQITCTGRPLYPYQSSACNLERDLARARTQRSMLAWATGAGIHKHSPSKPSPLTPNATSEGYVALLAYYYATCEKPVWGWQLARSSIKKRVDPRLKAMSAFQKLHRFHRAKEMGLDAVLDLE